MNKQEENKMDKSNTAVKVKANTTEKVNVHSEVNKIAVGTLAVAAGLVGAWVITAFVGGLLASGGIIPMVANWVHAVFG